MCCDWFLSELACLIRLLNFIILNEICSNSSQFEWDNMQTFTLMKIKDKVYIG